MAVLVSREKVIFQKSLWFWGLAALQSVVSNVGLILLLALSFNTALFYFSAAAAASN